MRDNLGNGISLTDSHNDNLTSNVAYNNTLNGILLTNVTLSNVTSNIAYNNTLSGINLANSDLNTLFNNTANNNIGNGISLTNSSNNEILDNRAQFNHENGIFLNQSSNSNNITENRVCGNWWNGIAISDSDWDYLANNTVCGNTQNGIQLTNSNNTTIDHNVIRDNLGNGISLNSSYFETIANNTITGNNVPGHSGIYLNNSGNDTIYNNWFNNTKNVQLEGINRGNTWNISKSDPYTNIYGGPYLGGNYYAQPDGQGWSQITPNRSDGFTTAPYRFDADNIDWLPLTNYTPKPPVPPGPGPGPGPRPYPYLDTYPPFPPFPENEIWDSIYISDTIPDKMNPCESRNVTITFENNGTAAWTSEKGVVLIPQSNCGITIIPQPVELERGVVINHGGNYTFNFTIIAPCTNTTCNLTARMSRYAAGKYQGIKFGDTAWRIVVVADQPKQVIKVLPANTTKASISLVSLQRNVKMTTFLPVIPPRVVMLPNRNETTYPLHNTSDLYTVGITDFNKPLNLAPITAGRLNVSEPQLAAIPKSQGIPIYPMSGNVSIEIDRKGPAPDISVDFKVLAANKTYRSAKLVAGQRDYLNGIPPLISLIASFFPSYPGESHDITD